MFGYRDSVHLASVTQSEFRITLDTTFELLNGLVSNPPDDVAVDTRAVLVARGFTRAGNASDASVQRLENRLRALGPFLRSLPDTEAEAAIGRVNEELTELPITPSIAAHDGVGPHMHWTPSTATFDDQVMADILMSLAHELCDNGTIRFGRCGASDCNDLFYDSTRNRSRRFCDDPRCASRTHTADHRARRRSN